MTIGVEALSYSEVLGKYKDVSLYAFADVCLEVGLGFKVSDNCLHGRDVV